MKSQTVRLLDVFVVGPFMIYAAFLIDRPIVRAFLVVLGVATIAYNGANYLALRQT